MTEDPRFATYWDVAQHAARWVKRQFPGAELEDLQQEGIAWILGHPERVGHHTFPDGSLYRRMLLVEVAGALAARERKVQNARSGLFPSDQYAYADSLVEVLLPGVFDPNYQPVRPDEERVGVSVDPSHGNNFQAAVADVRQAMLRSCNRGEQQALFIHSTSGLSWEKAQDRFGIGRETLRRRYRTGLRSIVMALNDRPPPSDDDEPLPEADTRIIGEALTRAAPLHYVLPSAEDAEGPAGGRRVLSNAQARAVASRYYEEA